MALGFVHDRGDDYRTQSMLADLGRFCRISGVLIVAVSQCDSLCEFTYDRDTRVSLSQSGTISIEYRHIYETYVNVVAGLANSTKVRKKEEYVRTRRPRNFALSVSRRILRRTAEVTGLARRTRQISIFRQDARL